MKTFQKSMIAAAAALVGWGGVARADLKFNEIDYDNPSTDTAEFVELYNTGPSAIDLTGYTLVGFNGANATDNSYFAIALSGSLPVGGYYVIGNVAGANIDPATNTDLIQNGVGDALAVYSAAFANGVPPSTTNLVTGVVYEGQDSFPPEFELIGTDDTNSDIASLQRSPLTPGAGAFLLATPPTPGALNSSVAVPEPAALGLLSLGGLATVMRRRRK